MKLVIAEPLEISEQQLNTFLSAKELSSYEKVSYDTKTASEEELLKRSKEAEILVIANTPLPASILKECTGLKMISVAFTGVNHIDLDYCKNNGIMVCNAAGYSTQAVAELTIGMMLDVLRNITFSDSETKDGGHRNGMLGFELGSKTVGIIGTGAIGQKVIDLLRPFGCRILAYSRSQKYLKDVEYVRFNELINEADIISLHLPLNNGTKNLMGKDQFAMMKPGSYLINTARGGIVNSQDLADALNQGKLAGAAVDVYEQEPPIEEKHPLMDAPNIITLPHIAYASKEAIDQRAAIVFRNISLFLAGTPQNVVL